MSEYIKLTDDIVPGQATHPGELIKDEIEYRKLTQKELAKKMGISLNTLNSIINGRANITMQIAVKLEEVLDISANYWLRLQIKYEIDTLRIRHKREINKANISNERKKDFFKTIFSNIKLANT